MKKIYFMAVSKQLLNSIMLLYYIVEYPEYHRVIDKNMKIVSKRLQNWYVIVRVVFLIPKWIFILENIPKSIWLYLKKSCLQAWRIGIILINSWMLLSYINKLKLFCSCHLTSLCIFFCSCSQLLIQIMFGYECRRDFEPLASESHKNWQLVNRCKFAGLFTHIN